MGGTRVHTKKTAKCLENGYKNTTQNITKFYLVNEVFKLEFCIVFPLVGIRPILSVDWTGGAGDGGSGRLAGCDGRG